MQLQCSPPSLVFFLCCCMCGDQRINLNSRGIIHLRPFEGASLAAAAVGKCTFLLRRLLLSPPADADCLPGLLACCIDLLLQLYMQTVASPGLQPALAHFGSPRGLQRRLCCVLLLISGRLFNAAVGVLLIRALTLLDAAAQSQAAHPADAGDVIMMLSCP